MYIILHPLILNHYVCKLPDPGNLILSTELHRKDATISSRNNSAYYTFYTLTCTYEISSLSIRIWRKSKGHFTFIIILSENTQGYKK